MPSRAHIQLLESPHIAQALPEDVYVIGFQDNFPEEFPHIPPFKCFLYQVGLDTGSAPLTAEGAIPSQCPSCPTASC